MRFEYYSEALANVPKLSVDGTVDNAVHFSHWNGNRTPQSVKADTSTEIALNVVAAPNRAELTQGIDLVTNNHFDTDGVRVSIMIQGSDSPIDKLGSPLAQRLAGEDVNDEARSYELVLPYVERVLTHINEYETLWRDAWNRIVVALDSFAKGTSRVDEDRDAKLSVVTLAPEIFSPAGFDPTQHSAPFTAISHHARGDLFLIATPLNDGWAYRIDYPYYSWSETIVRPRIERHDFILLITQLNESDTSNAGRCALDTK